MWHKLRYVASITLYISIYAIVDASDRLKRIRRLRCVISENLEIILANILKKKTSEFY